MVGLQPRRADPQGEAATEPLEACFLWDPWPPGHACGEHPAGPERDPGGGTGSCIRPPPTHPSTEEERAPAMGTWKASSQGEPMEKGALHGTCIHGCAALPARKLTAARRPLKRDGREPRKGSRPLGVVSRPFLFRGRRSAVSFLAGSAAHPWMRVPWRTPFSLGSPCDDAFRFPIAGARFLFVGGVRWLGADAGPRASPRITFRARGILSHGRGLTAQGPRQAEACLVPSLPSLAGRSP
jgi:hypothetical protein